LQAGGTKRNKQEKEEFNRIHSFPERQHYRLSLQVKTVPREVSMAENAVGGDQLKETALGLLPEFKKELLSEGELPEGDDARLLRFLYWKPNIVRAKERYHKLKDYYRDNPWAFGKVNDDPTLKRVLESEVIVSPDGMVDKNGHSVLVGRLRNNDMGDGRTPKDVVRSLIYTIDRVLERPEAQLNGIVIFHDMRGLSTSNIHPGIPKLLLNAIIGNFPLRIKGIYILDAPLFFRLLFNTLVGMAMPKKLRDRTNFVSSIDEVPIETSELLEEHGGERVHNQKAWVESHMKREKDGSMASVLDAIVIGKSVEK